MGMETKVANSTDASLDTLIETLRDGVIDLPVDDAVGAIIQWEGTLAQSADADLQAIAADLATLRSALTADTPDRATIGEILLSLGNRVQNYAGSADSAIQNRLLELGDLLNRDGARLGGAPRTEGDSGLGMVGRGTAYENSGPEVSSGSLTTGASFTSGSTTMQGTTVDINRSDIVDTDESLAGNSGGGK